MPRSIFLFIGLLVLTSVACSLMQGPPQPVIPTPPLLASPIAQSVLPVGVLPEDVVFNPVSNVVPARDPELEALLNSVSQQQLVGYVQMLESFGTRSTFSVVDRTDFGLGAARLWIYNEFLRVGNGRLQVEFDTFPLTLDGLTTDQQNVVATLRGDGSAPGAVLLVAHYDSRTLNPNDGVSRAPGANDNASGVAAMLEAARVLSSQTWNQDVVFIAFAAEEQGRHGSRHYITNRLPDSAGIDAVLDMDIVGGRPGIPQSVRVFSPGPDTSLPRQLARYLDFVGGLYLPAFDVIMVDAVDREGRYSDHMTFLDVGIPALRLTESVEDPNRNHNALDTSDALDYTYLRQITQLNLAAIANMIGAPPQPAPPTVSPMETAGSVILTWPVDGTAVGYVLSFRPVGTTDYAPFRFVRAEDAGQVAITDLAPGTTYALSMAALSSNGRVSLFSPEILLQP
ncbi:MAG: M20/M25/M40 family metallo-hydrolase [Chloroflexi bacterium]|nr:M20/M25/M40 family metallo-hydrolase [Chloroflexota bacterium]MBP7043810.1 M20/M25/M40 family metallo-hydrolase [Chloroflexota bacterium]